MTTQPNAIQVYTYRSCDTCRRAVKWLGAEGIAFTEKPIRETPPTVRELRAMLAAYGGQRRRILNTAGRDYRELKLADRLEAMPDGELFGLLSTNGNLVKRPFVCGDGVQIVGFNEEEWRKVLLFSA